MIIDMYSVHVDLETVLQAHMYMQSVYSHGNGVSTMNYIYLEEMSHNDTITWKIYTKKDKHLVGIDSS